MVEFKSFKIIIVGGGGIGRAVGLLLAEYADFGVSLFIGDRDLLIATEASQFVNSGSTKGVYSVPFLFSPGYEEEEDHVFKDADIVLDCLPGGEAPRIGRIARKHGLHYVNLTEYVNETEQLKEIAKDAETGFVLQTGLAPGFVNILANSLYQNFVDTYKNTKVEYIGMKVGALTENAESPHFYGFTWSPIGVATEYMKDALVIDEYQKVKVASLSGLESIIINGVTYEENFTSGGAADLPDAFAGIARKLDYKTLRYPGHYNWVKAILAQVPEGTDALEYLQQHMTTAIPSREKDMVILYAIVKGFDLHGQLRSMEQALKIEPCVVGNATLRAIQSTTAAAMAECARMLLLTGKSGVVLQSQIDPTTFLHGPFIKAVYFPEIEKLKKQVVSAA